MVGLIILGVAFIVLLSWTWSIAIENMEQNHKDYKGKDFLDEE